MRDKCGKRQRKHLGGVILNEDVIKDQLEELVESINSRLSSTRIEFNQQPKTKGNMSITGCNGRMFVQSSAEDTMSPYQASRLRMRCMTFCASYSGKNVTDTSRQTLASGRKASLSGESPIFNKSLKLFVAIL